MFAALRAENIGVNVHYIPVYWHPHYQKQGYKKGSCPRAEEAYEGLISLPIFPAMTDADVDTVIQADLVLIPYHGQPDQDEREIRRGKAKQGTTHFHCYATAYVIILKNKRYTLALTYVWGDEKVIDVLKRLLTRLKELDIGVRRLFLDRGFYNVQVIRYLKTQRIWFVMPVIIRGKKGGTRGLLRQQKKSGRTTYTMRNPKDG